MNEYALRVIENNVEWATSELGYISRRNFEALVSDIRATNAMYLKLRHQLETYQGIAGTALKDLDRARELQRGAEGQAEHCIAVGEKWRVWLRKAVRLLEQHPEHADFCREVRNEWIE